MDDFDWSRVRAFVVAAETGSFTAAARRLGLSQPTVGRQVATLEHELGVQLFERVGRRLKLTAAGQSLLEPAQEMGRAAQRLGLLAVSQTEQLAGPVCISCSDIVGVQLLAPALAAIAQSHPEIALEVLTTNDVSDLSRREADIAVRHMRPTQPELIGRRLVDGQAGMYASAAYLERLGPVGELADLQRARFIGFDRSELMVAFLATQGLELTHAHFPLVTASSVLQVELAHRGVGICFLSRLLARGHPGLRPVLADRIELPVPIWLVCHRELRTTARFRVVFDTIAAHLSAVVGG